MTEKRDDSVEELYLALERTGELEIDYESNRWLGEAEAIASDIHKRSASEEVIEKRARQIRELLENIDVESIEEQEARDQIRKAIEKVEKLVES